MKPLLLVLCLMGLGTTSALAQYGILERAVQRTAERVASRKIEEAVDRKVAEKTSDYYAQLLENGRIVSHAVQFEEGSATLLADSQPFVKALADVMRRESGVRIRIEAHTLMAGDAAANQRLAQRRADAVRAALITHGIEAARVSAKGLGETQPLYTDPDDEYAALNQRVEFVKL